MNADRRLLYLTVVIIGAATLLAVGGTLYLAAVGRPESDLLQNVAVGGVTALAAVLPGAKISARSEELAAPPPPEPRPPV